MGEHSEAGIWNAVFHAAINQTDAAGWLYFRNRGGNTYQSFKAHFGERDQVHFEAILAHKLKEATNSFANIPNESKIIICSTYSPCKQCMEHVVPAFINEVYNAHGGKHSVFIEFKIVFKILYSLESITNSEKINKNFAYDNDKCARTAYFNHMKRINAQFSPHHIKQKDQRGRNVLSIFKYVDTSNNAADNNAAPTT